MIVHKKYAGKQNPSDVFATVFLSDTAALTPGESLGIIKPTDKVLTIYSWSRFRKSSLLLSSLGSIDTFCLG